MSHRRMIAVIRFSVASTPHFFRNLFNDTASICFRLQSSTCLNRVSALKLNCWTRSYFLTSTCPASASSWVRSVASYTSTLVGKHSSFLIETTLRWQVSALSTWLLHGSKIDWKSEYLRRDWPVESKKYTRCLAHIGLTFAIPLSLPSNDKKNFWSYFRKFVMSFALT